MAEAASADDTPDAIARRKIGYLFDIIHARISAGAEIGRAAERLARLKGALDPARKPLPDRKSALDALMLTLVKSTDGPTLQAQMRAAGFTDV